MSEKKPLWKKVLMHAVILSALLFGLYAYLRSPNAAWLGVDEAVVEKIAKEHGREAKPLFDPSGDLLLFLFLVAGAAGGFAAGYYWRELTKKQ